jgi:hypothetical protein
MHVNVQKFTTTTRPRTSARSNGVELSHPVAPTSVGMRRRSKPLIDRPDPTVALDAGLPMLSVSSR